MNLYKSIRIHIRRGGCWADAVWGRLRRPLCLITSAKERATQASPHRVIHRPRPYGIYAREIVKDHYRVLTSEPEDA